MRSNRTLPLLAGLAALVAAAAVALACSGSDTKVSGSFDSTGRFVLTGAWGKDGQPIANAKGMVLESFTTEDNLVIPASNLAGKAVCLWGDFDAAKHTMHVAGYKECAAGSCETKGAMAQTAGGGASCCAAKGAKAQGATAMAATAGAGSSCAAKTDAATAGGQHCASKAVAQTAGAGAGCCAKDAAAKAASAGSSCTGDAAAAKANRMASATPNADAAAASLVVYSVSGMTCGGCASKVESAVAKLALKNVAGCTVDLEKGQAIVTTTGDVDREAIQKAITAAGFPAQPAAEATKG